MDFNFVRHSGLFLRKVTHLTVVTLIAQLITLLSLGILGYFFPIAMIGDYQVFVAYCALFSPLAILCYGHAMPNLVEEDLGSFLYGGICIIALVGLVLAGLLGILGYSFSIPVALWIWGWGIGQLADWYNIRQHRTTVTGLIKLFNALVFCIFIVSLYLAQIERVSWFVWGQAFITFFLFLGYFLLSTDLKIFSKFDYLSSKRILWQWRHNPIFLTPSQLLSTAMFNIPTLLIAHFFGSAMAAQYGMTIRFCASPITLLGNTIAQVVHSDTAALQRNVDYQPIIEWPVLVQLMKGLSIIVFFGLVVMLPAFFYFVLGPQWQSAAIFCQILAPLFVLLLYNAPMSRLYYVYNRQRDIFWMQGGYFMIAMGAFLLGIIMHNLWLAVCLFSLFGSLRAYFIIRELKQFVPSQTAASGLTC